MLLETDIAQHARSAVAAFLIRRFHFHRGYCLRPAIAPAVLLPLLLGCRPPSPCPPAPLFATATFLLRSSDLLRILFAPAIYSVAATSAAVFSTTASPSAAPPKRG